VLIHHLPNSPDLGLKVACVDDVEYYNSGYCLGALWNLLPQFKQQQFMQFREVQAGPADKNCWQTMELNAAKVYFLGDLAAIPMHLCTQSIRQKFLAFWIGVSSPTEIPAPLTPN
jgi:hypothetical protein